MDHGRLKVLVTGAGGRIGRALVPELNRRGHEVRGLPRAALDVADPEAIAAAVQGHRPEVVVNLAAYTDVDGCETDPGRAAALNALAVGSLADVCAAHDARLVQLSTDYVFSGSIRRPYREDDEPMPLSVYGATKLDGERRAGPSATVVRTAWLAGDDGPSVVRTVLGQLAAGEPVLRYVRDQVGSPTAVHDLVPRLADLIESPPGGVVHVANSGQASWFDLARLVAEAAGQAVARVEPVAMADFARPGAARRPANSSLECTRLGELGLAPLRPWQDAIADLVTRLLH